MSCLADRRDEHAVGAEAGGAVEPGGEGGVESLLAWRGTEVTVSEV